jgi:hypothetical protein
MPSSRIDAPVPRRSRGSAAVVAAALLASDVLGGCHPTDSPHASPGLGKDDHLVCEEFARGDFSTLVFGTPPTQRGPFDPPPPPPLPVGTGDNVRFLLGKAWRLTKAAESFEKELIEACTELGLAAGVPESDLRAQPDSGHGAERSCNAAATRVAALFRHAKETRVVLDVSLDATRCFEDVDATQKCLAECGAPVTGDPRAHCVGGELVGACAGRCSGACLLPAGAGAGSCHAACTGRCDREFRGKCGGKCTGTCDGASTRGPRPCSGTCDGSCSDRAEGFCGGRCDGSCAGAWSPPSSGGTCQGACVGQCLGTLSAALCSGEFAPRGAEPVCRAACGTNAVAALRCDPPSVRVAVRAGRPAPDLERALAGIQSAVPKIARLLEGPAKRVPHAIDNVVAAAIDWSNAFATAGPKPLLCIRMELDALRDAAKGIELAARGAEAIAPAIKTDPVLSGKPSED